MYQAIILCITYSKPLFSAGNATEGKSSQCGSGDAAWHCSAVGNADPNVDSTDA